MKTVKFFATLGVHEGYFHSNELKNGRVISIEELWQDIATKVYDETGVYVGAVFTDSKTVYHPEWGCPRGGEETKLITGECNPLYTNVEGFKEAVVKVLGLMADVLRQSTTQLTFVETEFVYLDFR